jgi:hypothetical protein
MPVTTFMMTFLDMLNALTPTPGTFAEGGHDYRHVLPDALSQTWQLPASDTQMERINTALRQRELAWELYRALAEIPHLPPAKQDIARKKALELASTSTGRTVDESGLQVIIAEGLQPRP